MLAKVSSFNEKDCSKSPPQPLTLVDLQSMGRSKFGYDLTKTLEIAQSLYDKKYQSYPRTDCPYYGDGHYLEVPDTLDMVSKLDPKYNDIINKMPKPYLKRNIFDDKKVTAHIPYHLQLFFLLLCLHKKKIFIKLYYIDI